MSDKRRDSKGRLLKQGERQREDGKYEYRYYDEKGGRHSVYSWRLVDTDVYKRQYYSVSFEKKQALKITTRRWQLMF